MPNHNGDSRVQVFISHKTEDKSLAEKIRDKLIILSREKLDPYLCYEIPGGTKYQEDIEESLKNSKILIFLYTSKEADLKWCLYEAGVFVGSNKFKNKYLLCLKASQIDEPPIVLRNLQSYNANEEGIEKFFTDLLCGDTFTGEVINNTLLTKYKREYKLAIEEIVREFSASVISTEFFSKRVSIKFPDALNGEDKIRIDQATITGNEQTMHILGIRNMSSWDNLYELYSRSRNAEWLDEIEECVQRICRHATPNRPLTPFRSIYNNKYYTPMVSRVERIQNNPYMICVIFIDSQHIMEKNDTANVPFPYMPSDQVAITQLVSMALTLRWKILEPYIEIIGRVDEQELKDHCRKLDNELSEFQSEGEGFKTLAVVANYFPVEDRPLIQKAANKYVDVKKEIEKAVDSPNRDEIIRALNDIRWANKVFLKKATEVCSTYIDELEPIEIKEN